MQPISSYQRNKILLFFRSLLFQLWFILTTIIYCPLMLSIIFLPIHVRLIVARSWAKCNLWAVEIFCGISYECEGVENIPKHGVAIVMCKHQSAWETLALQLFVPDAIFLLKRELIWLPVFGWAMATLKPISINRASQKAALKSLLKQGSERLKEGLWVIVFPEGTRTAPGQVKKFNAGGSLLAHKTETPVVPIAHNAGEYWPKYSFYKYPGIIKMKIGPVIECDQKKASEINLEVQQWIERSMNEIGEAI